MKLLPFQRKEEREPVDKMDHLTSFIEFILTSSGRWTLISGQDLLSFSPVTGKVKAETIKLTSFAINCVKSSPEGLL